MTATPGSSSASGAGRPRLLDLFSGAFGAGWGYHLAGFDVTGVDLEQRPRPDGVSFVQGDALDYLDAHGHEFDVIHASPPCHDWTTLRHVAGTDGTADLLLRTIAMLRDRFDDRPWIVENVPGTRPVMPGALTLCGTEFDLSAMCADGVRRYLKRHRLFLSNVGLWGAGGCYCAHRPIGGVYGTGGGGQMTRGYKLNLVESREAMGMPWADREGVSLAIPPAYTFHLGGQLLDERQAGSRSSEVGAA